MHRFEIWTSIWNIVGYLSLEFTFIKLIKKAFSSRKAYTYQENMHSCFDCQLWSSKRSSVSCCSKTSEQQTTLHTASIAYSEIFL